MKTVIEQPGKMWIKRKSIEDSITYDLKHSLRLYLNDCYNHVKFKDKPFNLVVKFDFKREGSRDDVKQIRGIAHHIRMYYRLHGIELLMIWARNCKLKSQIEECCLLIHIPEKNMEHFIKTAKSWRTGLECITVGYEADFEALGGKHNILDYMTRAMSTETKVKELEKIREESDYIMGYRAWACWALTPKNRYKISKGTS